MSDAKAVAYAKNGILPKNLITLENERCSIIFFSLEFATNTKKIFEHLEACANWANL